MSERCRLVGSYDEANAIGDMFFLPWEWVHQGADGKYHVHGYELSTRYVADWLGKRLPIMVLLPWSGHPDQVVYFCIDSTCTAPYDPNGWTVTGEAPNITVNPSINLVNIWHGWLRDGVLSE